MKKLICGMATLSFLLVGCGEKDIREYSMSEIKADSTLGHRMENELSAKELRMLQQYAIKTGLSSMNKETMKTLDNMPLNEMLEKAQEMQDSK